ncbi:hypothetical protein TNCV_1349731 [Trichonephila clavipes]|nr:hypothetical protein TNCV_1349731 [Trichonephila clavipes]
MRNACHRLPTPGVDVWRVRKRSNKTIFKDQKFPKKIASEKIADSSAPSHSPKRHSLLETSISRHRETINLTCTTALLRGARIRHVSIQTQPTSTRNENRLTRKDFPFDNERDTESTPARQASWFHMFCKKKANMALKYPLNSM